MTRLHTGTVAHPRYQSRPYRPAPARREHIFGKVQGIPDRRCGLHTLANGIVITFFAVVVLLCVTRGWQW